MEIASLWFDIDAPAVAPPAVTREQVLPLGSLSWENFERLCFRLAHRGGDVEDARIYGERGQAQAGLDLYVRRPHGGAISPTRSKLWNYCNILRDGGLSYATILGGLGTGYRS